MAKFSFVIPVYNSAGFLEECVASVLAQTVSDFEILLIDDGSTDGSGALCDALKERDDRIRVFHKENGGAASARNLGIEQAEGDYLLFLDGDDTIERNCLEVVEPTLCGGDCLPIFGLCFDYWMDGKIVRTDVCSTAFPGSHDVREVAKDLPLFFADNVLSSACNKVFPSRLLRDYHLRFPESMSLYEDFAFVLCCLPHFERISVIPQGLYHYRNLTDNGHLGQRVADLDRMRANLSVLNGILHEFGSRTGQIEKSASVSANLYIMLLEQHLLSSRNNIRSMREKLPGYLSEEGFQSAMRSGAKLDTAKRKLVTRIQQEEFLPIWLTFTGKRWKRKLRGIAKRVLQR